VELLLYPCISNDVRAGVGRPKLGSVADSKLPNNAGTSHDVMTNEIIPGRKAILDAVNVRLSA
jgi:hypothetical protein